GRARRGRAPVGDLPDDPRVLARRAARPPGRGVDGRPRARGARRPARRRRARRLVRPGRPARRERPPPRRVSPRVRRSRGPPRGPADDRKAAYAVAFVVLATSSATAAGRPGAREALDRALEVSLRHFWDEEAGMVVESWDAGFTELEPYRGVNANMHTVEAY